LTKSKKLQLVNPQNVANTAWAFAEWDVNTRKLLGAIEKRSSWLAKTGNEYDFDTIERQLSTLGLKSPFQ
jgi:hypothetical protein